MTGFDILRSRFDRAEARILAGSAEPRLANWPVVYTLNGDSSVYVGETVNAVARMQQHLANPNRASLSEMRIVVDPTFNKSVCLDLESFLIRLLSGDGKFAVENLNAGITDADYYDRERYRERFAEIFEALKADGLFAKSIPDIENSDLFKYSPFKSLTPEQAAAMEEILDGLLADLESGAETTSVVQGGPGTGKTIVAIYLVKLLRDIGRMTAAPEELPDSPFSDYFLAGNRELAAGLRIGVVVPQQSLRDTISRVFAKTPGLGDVDLLTPFQVGKATERYDLLVVDEAHRLSQRANMSSGVLNRDFREINLRLFGEDRPELTQLDWIVRQSRQRILMLDADQTVRPADLPGHLVRETLSAAARESRVYRLMSQMRVSAGADYISYVRDLLSFRAADPHPGPARFRPYRLLWFEDLGAMHDAIRRLDEQVGLSRLVAGYAWPWVSRTDRSAADIELDGRRLQWNRTATDWINSRTAVDEVGSIHTVQGYDLNYAGVIIGPELGYDSSAGRLVFNRASYFDAKGQENNAKRGITYSDDDLLAYVGNIYGVLLTRGILGTFVYVVDPALREHLRPFFAGGGATAAA